MNKIFYNIVESEYYFTFNDLKFYFSSIFYRDNFIKRFKEYLEKEQSILQNKYKMNIDFSIILLLKLYISIEKRGFYVFYKGKELKQFVPVKIDIISG